MSTFLGLFFIILGGEFVDRLKTSIILEMLHNMGPLKDVILYSTLALAYD